ncbi:MAG: hypothetical protein RIQ47_808 [Bacteroidota bacterium]|jgi:hypothetical protein
MLKLSQSTFDKLEELLLLGGYKVRTEKGNFKSGSCIVEQSKLIIVNKFSPVETKVTFLMEAIRALELDESLMDERYLKILHEVRHTVLQSNESGSEPIAETIEIAAEASTEKTA